MTNKDDTGLINDTTAKRLRSIIRSPGAPAHLHKEFTDFLAQERACASDVVGMLTLHQLLILNRSWKIMVADAGGKVEKIDVGTLSLQIEDCLKNMFSMGLMYGRAIFDQQFLESMPTLNEEEQRLANMYIELSKLQIITDMTDSKEGFLATTDDVTEIDENDDDDDDDDDDLMAP